MGMREIGVGVAVINNAEAVELYMKVFGLELGFNAKFPDSNEYQHASLVKAGKEVFSVMAADNIPQDHNVGFGVRFDTEEEVRKAFELLSKGGTVKEPLGSVPWSSYCATVIDKFGINWWISI